MTDSRDLHSLNIAPRAQSHSPGAWIILSVSAVALCTSLFSLRHRIVELDTLKEHDKRMQQEKDVLDDELRRRAPAGDTVATQRRLMANMQFGRMVHMSWPLVFDTLEDAALAVKGGASIISMTRKKSTSESVELELTAVAATMPIMLAYLDSLNADERVHEVKLITHQPDVKTSPDAIRFHVVVNLDVGPVAPHISPTSSREKTRQRSLAAETEVSKSEN